MSVAIRWPGVLLAGVLIVACSSGTPWSNEEVVRPHAANPFLEIEPDRHIDDDGVVLLMWEVADDRSLWGPAPAGLTHLQSWRRAIEVIVGGTDPAYLMQRNRELYPWLENEHEGQRRINRQVEKGELGRWRPMNALESYLLDFHAARYPLLEQPSELGALILSRRTAEGERTRIYYLTDGDGLPPRQAIGTVLQKAKADVQMGWDARAFLHNHTFDFANEKGMLAIAAPSESDLQIIASIRRHLEVDLVWIIDGFNSF
ncbi:MAG TPA: hypothetical protein VM534_10960, partial [Thermoanaerobaculia bacterium]|nr:hypothetical protein [Thermoanaerobaculia bacterium]